MGKITDTTYRQCTLRNGNTTTTTWLPDEYAKLGKIVDLKALNSDYWFENYEVISVSQYEISGKHANMISRAHLKHRNKSDI